MDILNMVHKANSGHVTTSLSAIDIITTLYLGDIEGEPIMNYNSKKPLWDGRDYFILSKGHGCPALYAVLAYCGFFPKEELDHLRQLNALLEGHPVRKIPGIEANTGPLGQGISFANGIGLAMKMDKKPNHIYVLLGDGELQEGQIWESAMTAAQYKLDNITAFVDANKLQQTNFTRSIKPVDPIGPKFAAFGWNVINVKDGHDIDEIKDAIRRARRTKLKPTVLVCDTVKGKGVDFTENKASYHGVPLSKEEMAVAIPKLEALYKKMGEQVSK